MYKSLTPAVNIYIYQPACSKTNMTGIKNKNDKISIDFCHDKLLTKWDAILLMKVSQENIWTFLITFLREREREREGLLALESQSDEGHL